MKAPRSAPIDVPATASNSTPSSCIASRTPRWAMPCAPPPDRARASVGRPGAAHCGRGRKRPSASTRSAVTVSSTLSLPAVFSSAAGSGPAGKAGRARIARRAPARRGGSGGRTRALPGADLRAGVAKTPSERVVLATHLLGQSRSETGEELVLGAQGVYPALAVDRQQALQRGGREVESVDVEVAGRGQKP